MQVRQLKAEYTDNVIVRFEIGGRHEMDSSSVLVEKLFQCPDLDEDAFEIIHDELHIFNNRSGKFFTLHATVVEAREVGWGRLRSPWNIFTNREKRVRESAGLSRPVLYEFF